MNIEQVRQEIVTEKQSIDDDYRQEMISTAIDNNTPPPKGNYVPYQNPSYRNMTGSQHDGNSNYEMYTSQHISSYSQMSNEEDSFNMHTNNAYNYDTPGPILINPNKNDKRMLTVKASDMAKNRLKPRNSQSYSQLTSKEPHVPSINTHSAMLANKKRRPINDNIHERLHAEAVRKISQQKKLEQLNNDNSKTGHSTYRNRSANRNQQTLIQNARSQRDRTPNNIGERLYKNGLKRLEEKEKKSLQEKMMREMAEVQNLTFKPKINPISRYFGRDDSKPLEDHLIEKGKRSKDMIEKKRNEELFERQNSHSFKPMINKNSEKMIMERSRQYLEESAAILSNSQDSSHHNPNSSVLTANKKLDKFMLLYDDAIKRKQRKDNIYSNCLDSECTFTPDVINSKYNESTYSHPDDVTDRLAQPSKIKEHLKIKYMHEELYDKETGQPLFMPKVGRPPLAKRDNLMNR